jgi:hypothetical protein
LNRRKHDNEVAQDRFRFVSQQYLRIFTADLLQFSEPSVKADG